MDPNNYSPKSRIKDIYIKLNNYNFHHHPYRGKESESRFIGRVKEKERIKSLITGSSEHNESGTYLITGFRGVGKTSIVRQVIAELNKKTTFHKHKWTRINVALYTLLYILPLPIILVIIIRFLFPICRGINIIDIITIGFIIFLVLFILYYKYLNSTLFSLNSRRERGENRIISVIYRILALALFFFLLYNFLNKYFPNVLYNQLEHLDLSLTTILNIILSIFLSSLWSYLVLVIFIFIYDIIYDIRRFLFKAIDKYYRIEINLSQDTLSERDFVKRINDKLISFFEDEESRIPFRFKRKLYAPFKFLFGLLISENKANIDLYQSLVGKMYSLRNRIGGSVEMSNESGNHPDISAEIGGGGTKLIYPFKAVQEKKSVTFPIATSKEAEDELISIFEAISELKKKPEFNLPTFIFVIDELDKIDPAYTQKSEGFNQLEDGLEAEFSFKQRQESIAALLANLKGFLNTVRAKFFFIGGRELFDADMADIADRDSFYSSIFNEVIYINTFYKDSMGASSREGITEMTEAFLVSSILGENASGNIKFSASLSNLMTRLVVFSDNKQTNKSNKSGVNSNKFGFNEVYKGKLLSTLQNTIIYLAYRSNGSIKKMTTLLEQNILKINKNEYIKYLKNDKYLFVYTNENNISNNSHEECDSSYFLKINFRYQQETSIIADIYRPYIIYNSRVLKSMGDKLLYSTPFIFDHILKFHDLAFSWRNIELIPEVVVSNNEPYLREHIQNILSFMGNYMIKETLGGLFDYKFHSLWRKELTVLSKGSDLASAAFNFSTEESQYVRNYLKRRLNSIKYHNGGQTNSENNTSYGYSAYTLHNSLADLYFYDKNYERAKEHYIESLRLVNYSVENVNGSSGIFGDLNYQFVSWMTSKLKLGLCSEKTEDYDTAISIYDDLAKTVEHLLNDANSLLNDGSITKEIGRTYQLITLPRLAMLGAIEKGRTDGVCYSNLYSCIDIISKLLATSEDGQKSKDYIDNYRRGYLLGDFYNSIGGILFYKNAQFTKLYSSNISEEKVLESTEYTRDYNFDAEKFKMDYFILGDKKGTDRKNIVWIEIVTKLLHSNHQASKVIRNGEFYPSLSCMVFYLKALQELTQYHELRILNILERKQELNPIEICEIYLKSKFSDLVNSKRYNYLASIIEKIADAILASLSQEFYISEDFMNNILNNNKIILDNQATDTVFKNIYLEKKIFSIEFVLSMFILAGELFKKAGNIYAYVQANKRQLYLMKELVNSRIHKRKKYGFTMFDGRLDQTIVRHAEDIVKIIYRAVRQYNNCAIEPMLVKYGNIVNEDYQSSASNWFKYANNIADIKEAILATESIRLRLFKVTKHLLQQYDKTYNRFIRMLELKYQLEYLHVLYNSGERKISYIAESLSCIRECILTIQLLNPGFGIGYLYLANAHSRAVFWIKEYGTRKDEDNGILKTLLNSAIGRNSQIFLSPLYHLEAAKGNYEKLMQLHTEGNEYMHSIRNIYLMEDDYNDLFTHFNISLERYRMNIGEVKAKVVDIESDIEALKKTEKWNYSNLYL